MKNNLKLISSDDQAREITLQDVGGGYVDEATTVIVKVDKPFGDKDGIVKYVNAFNPQHPEWLVIPKASQIGQGKVFKIDSQKLGITTTQQGYYSFKDGVLNLNYHVGFGTIQVTGTKGFNYLIGTNLDEVLEAYDSVIVGVNVYNLDKSKPTNAGTVMYLFEDLLEDVTEVVVAERSNLKIYNDFRTKCLLCKTSKLLTNGAREFDNESAVFTAITNHIASKIQFQRKNYLEADRLLKENVLISKYLIGKDGCEIC